MRIKTLMRDPAAVVAPHHSLADAVGWLAAAPGRPIVAVEGRRVVGILTETDARAAGPSSVPALAAHDWPWLVARLTVADAMRPAPVVAAPESDVAGVARALRVRGHRAAVVADGGDVVGAVTSEDLLGALVEALERAAPPRLARLVAGVALAASRHAALDLAAGIARCHRAELTLVHAIPSLSRRVAEGLPWGVRADLHRWRLAQARTALAALVPCHLDGVRTEIKAGDVVSALVETADATGAELIVIGGRADSALVRATIRRAPCPVLAA
jgi:CBS domain-containing protein